MEEVNKGQMKLIGLTGDYTGNTYILNKDEFSIGRQSECDLIMKEKTISAQHARILRNGNDFEITDLDSMNGTFINGVKIKIQKLRTHDRIKFNIYEFLFINLKDAPRTEMVDAPEFIPKERREKEKVPHKFKKKEGNIAEGLILGLTIAFILSYAGVLIGSLIGGKTDTTNILNLFKNQLITFPLFYLPTFWMKVQLIPAIFLTAFFLPFGPFIGGNITRRIGRRSLLRTAFFFSILYISITLLIQLLLLRFNIHAWQNISMNSRLGIQPPIINILVLYTYFFALIFIIAIIGAHIGKRQTQ